MTNTVCEHVVGDTLLQKLEHHFNELCAPWGTDHSGQRSREVHSSGGLADDGRRCVHLLGTYLLTRRL